MDNYIQIIFSSFTNGKQSTTQAQQMIPQDINVEDVLRGMVMVEGAKEYLVLNSEGTLIFIQEFPSRRVLPSLPRRLCICPS